VGTSLEYDPTLQSIDTTSVSPVFNTGRRANCGLPPAKLFPDDYGNTTSKPCRRWFRYLGPPWVPTLAKLPLISL
jgi:hypothetical protein